MDDNSGSNCVESDKLVSKCCGKPVRREDDGQGQWSSNWYVCTGCDKPTEAKPKEN